MSKHILKDTITLIMYGISELHDHILFFLFIILFIVMFIFIGNFDRKKRPRSKLSGGTIGIIRGITSIQKILFFLVFSSCYVGRFLQVLGLTSILVGVLVILVITLYAFLYGKTGLRAAWGFFAKWGSKLLIMLLRLPTLCVALISMVHVLLSGFFLLQPLLTNKEVKISVHLKPVYEFISDTYIRAIRYMVTLFCNKYKYGGCSHVDQLTDTRLIIWLTGCLIIFTVVGIVVVTALEIMEEHYATLGGQFLAGFYKVTERAERVEREKKVISDQKKILKEQQEEKKRDEQNTYENNEGDYKRGKKSEG